MAASFHQGPPMPLAAFSFPMIDPVAVSIGPFAIRWYALAYVVGLLGGWYYAKRLAARADHWAGLRQPKPLDIDDLIVWVAFGVVLGGRLGYVLFYNFGAYLSQPLIFRTRSCFPMRDPCPVTRASSMKPLGKD
jgi:phosphatidylglycerol:prolipoprotein diacylglycerol transferase